MSDAEAAEPIGSASLGTEFSSSARAFRIGASPRRSVLRGGCRARANHAEGIIFETPSGIEGAQTELDTVGVAERCRLVAGDFFGDVPETADAYILKSILHGWDDERAVAILKTCRRAMRRDSTLLVVERLLPERIECSNAHREIVMMDVHMLAVPGGRERTASDTPNSSSPRSSVRSTCGQRRRPSPSLQR